MTTYTSCDMPYRLTALLICSLALLALAVACENPEPSPSGEVSGIVAMPPTPAHTATPEPTFTPISEPTATPEPTPAPPAAPKPSTAPTPAHTPTPDPFGRSQESTAPAGSTVVTGNGLALTIVSVNLDAADIALNESVHNDPPGAGNRFVMARVRVQNVGGHVNIETYVGDSHFDLVGSSTVELSWYKQTCGVIPDELNAALFRGGIGEGNVCFEIPESETDLTLIHQSPCPFGLCVPDRRWLEFANPDVVEAPRIVDASLAPSPGQAPGYFRTNPAPPGTTVEAKDGAALTVLSVNPDAAAAVMNEHWFNEPPAKGNRFVMARVRVQNVGGDANSEISDFQFDLVGSSAVMFMEFEDSCGVIPNALYAALFPGGIGEGNVCFEIPESETDLTLIYDPRIYDPETSLRLDEERRWLTLANPDVVEAPRVVDAPLMKPSPDQELGYFRTNPVPPGMSVETDDGFAITVVSVNPNAAAAIAQNPFNKPPADGNRFIIARVRMENAARKARSDWRYFSLVGSSGVKFWSFNACGTVPDEIEDPFTGIMAEGNVCFQIPESETDLILIYDSSVESQRRWMKLP